MPSDTSSVIVLPINVAPASSKCCTAQEWCVGTGFDRAQSGLPPPVGKPATSNRSLAAKVSPESGPPFRPSMWTRGPGTKALMSSGIKNSFVGVPDVRREFPLAADLAPYDRIFPDDFLWRLALRLQCDGADLARRIAAERQHVEGRQLGVAHLLRRLTPERLDGGAALDDVGAGRKHVGVLGIHRCDRLGVALVEGRRPRVVELLDRCLVLRERGRGRQGQAHAK